MKVLQVNKNHYEAGGANRYYIQLSRILEEYGHSVVYFSMKDKNNLVSPYTDYFLENVDFTDPSGFLDRVRCFGRVIYSFEARQQIERIIEDYRPEITHLHNIYHQISPSFLPVLKKRGLPVVMTAHDYKLICPNYTLFDGCRICEKCRGGRFYYPLLTGCHQSSIATGITLMLEAYLHRMLRSYENYLDLIITPSRFMKELFHQFGMPAEKVIYIPNFVEPIPEKIERDEEEFILYFGRLSSEKGLITLIRAMLYCKDTLLVIAGDGPDRKKLEEICEKENIFNIRFVGQKNAVEIQHYVKKSLLTVLPSIWYENCPLSILESMAQGRPVIGSRIGGIPDLIEDGMDGLLFSAGNEVELGEKIELLVKDREYRRELGDNGHKKVKGLFNKRVHYQAIQSVYNRLLSS